MVASLGIRGAVLSHGERETSHFLLGIPVPAFFLLPCCRLSPIGQLLYDTLKCSSNQLGLDGRVKLAAQQLPLR